jgi:hypothetical protein
MRREEQYVVLVFDSKERDPQKGASFQIERFSRLRFSQQ